MLSRFFLPIAFRRRSASASEYPATLEAIRMTCSWYTRMPSVSSRMSLISGNG